MTVLTNTELGTLIIMVTIIVGSLYAAYKDTDVM